MQLRSSRISMMLQGVPEIVGPSKRQADVRRRPCVHWHMRSLHTPFRPACGDRSCALAFERGVGQLGSKLQVRQIKILRCEGQASPSRCLEEMEYLDAIEIGCHKLIPLNIVSHFCTDNT